MEEWRGEGREGERETGGGGGTVPLAKVVKLPTVVVAIFVKASCVKNAVKFKNDHQSVKMVTTIEWG